MGDSYQDYTVRIPIEIYGRDNLTNILQSLQGMSAATRKLTNDQRDFVNLLRDEVNVTQNLDKSLKQIIEGTVRFTESQRMMAMGLRALISDLNDTNQAADRVTQTFGRVGGRILGAEILGKMAGVPGGGFIGSQLIYSLGSSISPGALAGVGAAGIGVLGGYAAYNAYQSATKSAQSYRNQATELGVSTNDAQMLAHVSDISGVQLSGVVTVLHKMNEELLAGGPNSKKIAEGLHELGLNARVAFEDPITQLRTMLDALRAIDNQQERSRLSVQLFGESGRQLLPLVDSFRGLSDAMSKSGTMLSPEMISQLERMREQSALIKEEWVLIWEKIGAITGIIASGALAFLSSSGFLPGTGGPDAPTVHPSGRDALRTSARKEMDQRRANAGLLYTYEINQADHTGHSAIENLMAEKRDLEVAAGGARNAGPDGHVEVTTGNNSTMMPALEAYQLYQRRIRAKELQIKDAQRYQSQMDAFRGLSPQSEMTAEGIANEGKLAFGRRFSLLHNLPAYREREAGAQGAMGELGNDAYGRLLLGRLESGLTESEREKHHQQMEMDRFWAGEVRDTNASTRAGEFTAHGAATSAAHAARVASALRQGFSRYGLTPSALARTELSVGLENASGEYSGRATGLNAEIANLRTASLKYGNIQGDEAARHKEEVDAQILQKQSELEAARNDAITKSIDVVNHFNESITKAAEAIRTEIAHGLTGIVMGAQSGGARGARRGVMSFVTGQEGHILNNVFEHLFDTKGIGKVLGKAGSHLPDWLTKGTIFAHTNDPMKLNTDATVDNTKATIALTAAYVGKGGVGIGGGPGGGGASSPGGIAGTLAKIYGRIKGGTGSPGGAASGDVSEDGVPIGQDTLNHGVNGDVAGETNNPAGGPGVGGYAAAGIGTAAGLYGVFTSGSTKGKLSSGGGALMAAGAVVPGPAGWVMMGVGAALTLSGMLLGDPRQERAQGIEKTTFTQRYLAPEAIHMMASSSGTYADQDIYGNVRSSHFSPYPIVSDAYLDVPRRTVVPGHTLSPFGGFQNVTGAMTPTVIHYHNWNVQTLDGKSFIDNGHKILDAVNHELNSAYHPAVHTIGKQLGIR